MKKQRSSAGRERVQHRPSLRDTAAAGRLVECQVQAAAGRQAGSPIRQTARGQFPYLAHAAMDHFKLEAPARPCWHCVHFLGLDSSGCHARCSHRGGGVHASPARGCTYWQREPGIDDEPGPPPGFRPPVQRSIYRPGE